jgi:primosomal protein N' (replication factor Y) (superfamily II helicase)
MFGRQNPYNASMWYVEVVVADASYHKDEALTYAAPITLEAGRLVMVPLRNKTVMGLVLRTVGRPHFAVKTISSAPDLPPLPPASMALLRWLREYYPAPLGITAQLFLPKALPKGALKTEAVDPAQTHSLPPLTNEQQEALATIRNPGLHLLHGDTGSGKTRVYLELARRSTDNGKSSLILTPEIGLTSQLADDFKAVFGKRVLVVHSGLGEAVRRQLWHYIHQAQEPLVIIGARSALFSPLKNLGLIVVDEAHEPAYKQDQAPYYQAAPVAAQLARLQKAIMVIGSATPLVSDYYIAKTKGRPVVRMTQLAAKTSVAKRQIQVIDLKNKTDFTRSRHLSNELIAAIYTRLANHEQSLLFLNRRGTARVVFCERCGWQANCPHCDLPLVYHGDIHVMRCHSCSYRGPNPASCPDCQSSDIIFTSIGSKAITEEVNKLFPEACVMRFDSDNKKAERLDEHLSKIRAGKVDILIGTQTLAKGLDLPKLGLVGVIMADAGLYFPDFSAQERSYQLLSQVMGRVGRGHRDSQAIIQTYAPNSPLLRSIVQNDWSAFYNKEIEERRAFLFPPFCYILKLTCKRATSAAAQKTAEAYAQKIRSHNNNILLEGPAPSFHERQENKFAWQLIIKATRRNHLTAIIKNLPSGWQYDIDPINLL